MSKLKEIFEKLSKLESLISGEKQVEAEQVQEQYLETKTADGKILRCLADVGFQMGAIVSIIQEDGTVIPAPTGVYTLEDGTVYEIQDGTIVNVTMPEAETEPAVEVEVEEQSEVKVENKSEILIEELQKEISELKSKLEAFEKEKVELQAEIKKIGEQPSVEPLKKSDKKENNNQYIGKTLRSSVVLNSIIGKRN